MANPAGRVMEAISPPRASVSLPILSGRPICGPYRIGSSGRSSGPFQGLPASTHSAVFGKNITSSQIRPSSSGLDLSFGDVATAIENNNLNRGASYVEDNGEAYAVRSAGR